MNILNYYLDQQNNTSWYTKFQSTSSKQSGKTFSYINTNFRGIDAFLDQIEKFYEKNGLERSEWKDNMRSGQEADKHRVINLLNAGFFKFETDCYLITPKGLAIIDLIKDDSFNDSEKWFILFLLLLDYKNEEREFDVLLTTKEIFEYIIKAGYTKEEINNFLWTALHVDKKDVMFSRDIFWLVSFARDDKFLIKYYESTQAEKESLHEYVIACSKNKKTKDCIAHKFIGGGAYTTSTFIDDLKMLFFANYTISNNFDSFEDYLDKILFKYKTKFPTFRVDKTMYFIKNHKSIFKIIYKRLSIIALD